MRAAVGFLLVCSGWLIASPRILGFTDGAQAASDVISGVLVAALAVVGFVRRRPGMLRLTGLIGGWLILAPIVWWAPSAAAYASDTLTGVAIVFAGFVVPVTRHATGPSIPDGWSYNPSTWGQRLPVIILTIVAFGIAAYMAAFQLGYIADVWDPIFGDGTRRVLTSDVSKAFPVSDAGLGAATYLIDLVMTCAGDRRRWRTMPWLVIVFGVLIVPVGIVSVVLIMLQPIAVGAWCFWCLLTAAATLAMVPLAIDEVAATLQLLRRVRNAGGPWTRVLWHGDPAAGSDIKAPRRADVPWAPWGLIAIGGVGVWLMVERAALGTTGAYASSTTISGALALVIAAVAASEIARPVRFAAIPLAAWVVAAPWLLSGTVPTSFLSSIIAAVVLLPVSLFRGPVRQHRATLDKVALWPASSST